MKSEVINLIHRAELVSRDSKKGKLQSIIIFPNGAVQIVNQHGGTNLPDLTALESFCYPDPPPEVPEGRPTIARRFNAGTPAPNTPSPAWTAENSTL